VAVASAAEGQDFFAKPDGVADMRPEPFGNGLGRNNLIDLASREEKFADSDAISSIAVCINQARDVCGLERAYGKARI